MEGVFPAWNALMQSIPSREGSACPPGGPEYPAPSPKYECDIRSDYFLWADWGREGIVMLFVPETWERSYAYFNVYNSYHKLGTCGVKSVNTYSSTTN